MRLVFGWALGFAYVSLLLPSVLGIRDRLFKGFNVHVCSCCDGFTVCWVGLGYFGLCLCSLGFALSCLCCWILVFDRGVLILIV